MGKKDMGKIPATYEEWLTPQIDSLSFNLLPLLSIRNYVGTIDPVLSKLTVLVRIVKELKMVVAAKKQFDHQQDYIRQELYCAVTNESDATSQAATDRRGTPTVPVLGTERSRVAARALVQTVDE